MEATDGFLVDFPTLGDLGEAWTRQHCRIPDGYNRGAEFVWSDWQFWCSANYYRIRPGVEWIDGQPLFNQAFTYRRAQIVAPQKALALDTPIATPDGWSTMAALQVGDFVFDEQGDPTRVVSKSPVWHSDTYRVAFSDGSSLTACKDHQWWVEWRNPSSKYVPMRVRTEDLVGNLVRDGARVFRVPNAKPLQLPDAELLLDPYTLGAWLGDGNSDDGRLTGLDVQIWENIELAGHEVRRHKVEKRVGVVGLKATLRRLGVLNNKHIPAEYLRSSEKQRWSLLQGLMDTDGHCDERQGKCEFTTTLSALRDGMLELLASLGIRPKCYSGHATLKGRVTGPKWRIAFSARSDMPVFGLDRKQERLRSPGRGHAQFGHRRIVSVERVETVPTQCLTVAADSHVFLAGREMIPTCNTGKGPWSASMATFEAVGPSQFLGWAGRDDGYACSDYGCSCGWEFPYEPGEPMGMRHPSPVIQLTATNEDQVDNVYRPLTAMIRLGPLSELLFVREGFVRIAGESPGEDFDRIDAVTSSANGRVGNPVSWVLHDESGLYTRSNKMLKVAQDQRRGAAGMNGRTMETTNAWDPAENSTAQQTYESRVTDVFKFYRIPPVGLSWGNKRERRKILKYVYEGSPWVNLDSIEAEALEIGETDPAQAERFFGNRLVYGQGSWLRDGLWNDRYVDAVAS